MHVLTPARRSHRLTWRACWLLALLGAHACGGPIDPSPPTATEASAAKGDNEGIDYPRCNWFNPACWGKVCRPYNLDWPQERRCLPRGGYNDACDGGDHGDCDASQGLVCRPIEYDSVMRDPLRAIGRRILYRCLEPGGTLDSGRGAPCRDHGDSPECQEGLRCIYERLSGGSAISLASKTCQVPFEQGSICRVDADCRSHFCHHSGPLGGWQPGHCTIPNI